MERSIRTHWTDRKAADDRNALRGRAPAEQRTSRDKAPLAPDSSPETSAFRGLRAVRISPEALQLFMCSCISASGTVNQRPFGARGLSMRGETIREHARDGRPCTRPCHAAGPPRETSTHAQPLAETARGRCAKRERPGREARAFTLNRSARQFRARLLK